MYDERQFMLRNPVMWVILPILIVAVSGGVASAWAFGNNEDVAQSLLGVAAIILVSTMNLRTRIEARHLMLTFWPIWRRTISIGDVQSAAPQAYVWWHFGGWGIRLARGATAYTVAGRGAVRLNIHGKRDLVIGTRDTAALLAALAAEGVAIQTTP